MSEQSAFEKLAALDVGKKIEKKGNLSYLSWAWAVDQLLRSDPGASWEYREFDGRPFLTLQDGTAMVFCTVTVHGVPRTMQLPVMDHRNKAIAHPDAFAVNTAMQRCLVKAMALHGLGLYIYAGEDVPNSEGPEAANEPDEKWAKEAADWVAAIEGADTLEAAKSAYHKAVGFAKDHEDVKAASAFKATLMARKDAKAAAHKPEHFVGEAA